MSVEYYDAEWQLEDWLSGLLGATVNSIPVHVGIDEASLESSHIVVFCKGQTLLDPFIPGHWAAQLSVSVCTMIDAERVTGFSTARAEHKETCLAVRNLIWTDTVADGTTLAGGLKLESVEWGETENEVDGRYCFTRHNITVQHCSGGDE